MDMNTTNARPSIRDQLIRLGIIDEAAIEPFFPRVRDREDVQAFRCRKSGVVFLAGDDSGPISAYADREGFAYWTDASSRAEAKRDTAEDDQRRVRQFGPLIHQRRWLDVGTGNGGILDLLKPSARTVGAVEPQPGPRKALQDDGYTVYPDIRSVPVGQWDTVTLFHVFEHLSEPLAALCDLRHRLAEGGRIVIEVPHAGDFLLSFLGLEPFKAFTLWSEHLILHTRGSLQGFLTAAGFRSIVIQGFQRYPLANHLHWLAKGKPGGHQQWAFLNPPDLQQAYASMLAGLDQTDTLIAVAEK